MFDDAIGQQRFERDADDDSYEDARCPSCGAAADEECAFDCCGEDEDEEEESD